MALSTWCQFWCQLVRHSGDLLNCPGGVLWRQMRVANRHRHGFVAGQFHHRPQIDASHDQPRDKRVATYMPRDILEFGFGDDIVEPGARGFDSDWLPTSIVP